MHLPSIQFTDIIAITNCSGQSEFHLCSGFSSRFKFHFSFFHGFLDDFDNFVVFRSIIIILIIIIIIVVVVVAAAAAATVAAVIIIIIIVTVAAVITIIIIIIIIIIVVVVFVDNDAVISGGCSVDNIPFFSAQLSLLQLFCFNFKLFRSFGNHQLAKKKNC